MNSQNAKSKDKKSSTKKHGKKGKIERFINKTLNLIPTHHKQFTSSNALVRMGSFRGGLTGRWYRKAIRNAVLNRDVIKLKDFLSKGLDLHTIITEVYWDTPLTYAVKSGYLDIVELLLHIPGCNVDHKDRNNHSTLDEAIKALLSTTITDSKRVIGNRYRIIKNLLCAGAKEITPGYIDAAIFSVINTKLGHLLIQRLVKVVAEYACVHVKSTIFILLIPNPGTSVQMKILLNKGANPHYLAKQTTNQIPVKNAICLVKFGSCNKEILKCIQYNASQDLTQISTSWTHFQTFFRILVMSRVPLRLIVLDYLYQNQATFYKWMLNYTSQPLSLLDSSRLKVRTQIKGNIIQSIQNLATMPESIRSILVLD